MPFDPAAPPAPAPTGPPAPPASPQPLDDAPEDILRAVAKAQGVDPDLLMSIAQVESGMNPRTLPSNKGAIGLMQLMPATAARHKVNINDPYENALGGAMELRDLQDAYGGDLEMMARRYNGRGPATTAYAHKVLSDYEHRKGFAPGTLTGQLSPNDPNTAPKAPAQPKVDPWSPEGIAATVQQQKDAQTTQVGQRPPHPWMSGLGDMIVEGGKGVLKGAGQTATNLGSLVHKIPGVDQATDWMYGMAPGSSQEAFRQANEQLVPSNTAQSVGKMGEQVAELFAPAGEISKVATGAEKLLSPSLAPYIGETLAKLAPRMAVEGAGGAALAGAQGGDVKTGALLGAAVPAVGKLAEPITESLAASAKKLVTQAFDPRQQRYKAIAERIIPEVLQRGITGGRKAVVQNAWEKMAEAGEILDQHLAQFTGSRLRTGPAVQALETAKDAFRTTGAAGNVVEIDPTAIAQLDKVQDIIKQLGPRIEVEKLVKIRQVFDDIVAQAGGYAHRAGKGAIGLPLLDASAVSATREAAGAIRHILADQIPDLAALNKEYSFWANLHDVVNATVQRTGPYGPGLGEQILQTGAMAAGAAKKGLAAGFVAGQVMKLATRTVRSPAWKLASAQIKDNLATALASQSLQGVLHVAAELGVIKASQLGNAPPLRPPSAAPPPPPKDISLSITSDPQRATSAAGSR